LLDYYPLRRLGGGPGRWFGRGVRRGWVGELPLFSPAVVFLALAFLPNSERLALGAFEAHRLASRVPLARSRIRRFFTAALLPIDLTAYHPLPERVELLDLPFLLPALATACVSLALLRLRRRWPGLLAVWASYLIMLAPNLGLVRITSGLVSDRYSYFALA